jgi:hypothetical protein
VGDGKLTDEQVKSLRRIARQTPVWSDDGMPAYVDVERTALLALLDEVIAYRQRAHAN